VSGVAHSLWLQPDNNIYYVEHSWYTSLKDFLSHIEGTIDIPNEQFLHWQPLRTHDCAIMESLSSLLGVSRTDLKAFNQCRLYYGVMFLSEITSADGLSLSRDAWNGTHTRYSPLLWHFQPSPGPKSWVIWRRLLARPFLASIPNVPPPKPKICNYFSLSVHGSLSLNVFFRNGHTAIPLPMTRSITTLTISMECTFPSDAAASGASSLVPQQSTLLPPYPPIVFPWRNFLRPLRFWPSVVSRLAEPPLSHPKCQLHLRIISISSGAGTNDYFRMSPSVEIQYLAPLSSAIALL
jgi:hypothetical protein